MIETLKTIKNVLNENDFVYEFDGVRVSEKFEILVENNHLFVSNDSIRTGDIEKHLKNVAKTFGAEIRRHDVCGEVFWEIY